MPTLSPHLGLGEWVVTLFDMRLIEHISPRVHGLVKTFKFLSALYLATVR